MSWVLQLVFSKYAVKQTLEIIKQDTSESEGELYVNAFKARLALQEAAKGLGLIMQVNSQLISNHIMRIEDLGAFSLNLLEVWKEGKKERIILSIIV